MIQKLIYFTALGVFFVVSCGESKTTEGDNASKKEEREIADTAQDTITDQDTVSEISNQATYTLEDYERAVKAQNVNDANNLNNILDSAELLLSAQPDLSKKALDIYLTYRDRQAVNYNPEKDPGINQIWKKMVAYEADMTESDKAQKYFDERGYILENAEGDYYLSVSPVHGMDVFQNALTEEYRAYLDIVNTDATSPYAADAGLMVSLTEIANRADKIEGYVKTYYDDIDQARLQEIQGLYERYLFALFTGLDNTSNCDYTTGQLRPEVKTELEAIAAENTNTDLGMMLRNLMTSIEENGGKCDYELAEDAIKSASILSE